MSDDNLKEGIAFVRKIAESKQAEFWPTVYERHLLLVAAVAAESMLLAPMMPPKATPEMIADMVHACAIHINDPAPVMQNIYAAIHRHLTKPKTKMAEAWHVHYAHCPNGGWEPEVEFRESEREAGHRAARLREEPTKYQFIRVSGPHQQEVPA